MRRPYRRRPRTRGRDPYWITAWVPSVCGCGKQIAKGDPAYYYPNSRKVVCQDCGRRGEAALADEIANESMHVM